MRLSPSPSFCFLVAAAVALHLGLTSASGQVPPGATNEPAQPTPLPVATGPRPLDLAALVAEALDRNPSLAALRLKREAMDEEQTLARAFDNPRFTVESMDEPQKVRFPGSAEMRIGIEQSFPGLGKRRLRSEVAQRSAEAMGYEYLALSREITTQVKEAYYELYALQKVQAIARAEEELLKRLVKVAETRYATGSVSQQDVLKAQSEGAMVRARLLEWDAHEAGLRARLNALLYRAPDSTLGRAATPPKRWALGSRAQLIEQAAKHHAEIRAAEVTTLRNEAARLLAGQEYFPDFAAGLQYVRVADEDDMLNLMLGVDLPIWGRRNRANLKQADLTLQSSQAALAAARSRVEADVAESWAALVAAQKTADLYETELVPQADARFRASEPAYAAGKTDFMDLLESERFLLEARVMHAMAEGSLGMRQARLEQAVGRDLP